MQTFLCPFLLFLSTRKLLFPSYIYPQSFILYAQASYQFMINQRNPSHTASRQTCIKRPLHMVPFHLTRLFELKKSCWEICDSQRVWKSQITEYFRDKSDYFLQKQTFVSNKWHISVLLSDIFPIPSHAISIPSLAIYFSSHAILKISDRIGKTSDKIWERSEKIKKKSESTEENFRSFPKRNGKREKKQRIVFSRRPDNLVKNGLPF